MNLIGPCPLPAETMAKVASQMRSHILLGPGCSKLELGSRLRFVAAIFCLFSLLAVGIAQAKGTSQSPVSASIVLPVGSKVPHFALHDQFDRAQSNETPRGGNGTILLFFRTLTHLAESPHSPLVEWHSQQSRSLTFSGINTSASGISYVESNGNRTLPLSFKYK
jgi:hypothetical protein